MTLRSAKNQNNSQSRIMGSLVTAVACRILLNTARRFIYPFAPTFARGLGVPLTAVTSLIAVNQATSIIGLFFGPVSDRIGYRVMMLCSLGMLALGMLAAGLIPVYGIVLIALFLAGLGKSIFDPAIQAFVGERVSYHRRGQAVGFLEVSWAGSSLIGIPLMAFLISSHGWRSPFFVLGLLALVGGIVLGFLLPKDRSQAAGRMKPGELLAAYKLLSKNRAAMGALVFAFFFNGANDIFFVVYGAWLENAFDISVMALGAGTAVIGVAELCGEGLTAFLSDRLGLKKAVVIGAGITVINYALLPFYSHSLVVAFTGIFILFLSVEFTIVTSIALYTEILPNARATMIAAVMAAAGLGRVAGALAGGVIWLSGGIVATGIASAAVTGLALMAVLIGFSQWQDS
ncbi:MAG: MFS transporter [Thermodesulfobacteriota bacterium]